MMMTLRSHPLAWRAVLAAVLAGAALAVAGCGSTVSLNDVPVEDRKGAPVTPGTPADAGAGQGAQGQGTARPPVTTVDLGRQTVTVAGPTAKVVYFDYDSFEIRPDAQPVIDAHARWLAADRSRKVFIEGHTDERGGREYNLALGQKRAEAVRRALVLLNVQESQVEPVSFGKEKPAVPGSSEEAMARNRRAEFNYR